MPMGQANKVDLHVACAMLAALCCAEGCKQGDDVGSGPSSGAGQGPQCQEVVDSAAITQGTSFTPYIKRIDGGYVVGVINGGEAWVIMLNDDAAVTSRHQLSNAGGQARAASVYPVGGNLVAIWSQGSAVFSRTLDGGGTPTGEATTIATTTSPEPRPTGASNGDTLAVAFQNGTGATVGLLSGGTLSSQATVAGKFPAVGASGSSMAASWSGGGEQGPVNVAKLNAMGSPTNIPGSASLIQVLEGGPDGGFFVGWEDVGSGTETIGLAALGADGGLLAQGNPAEGGSSANWPALSWSGDYLAVAYYQFRDNGPSVFLTYVDAGLTNAGAEVEIAANAKYPSVAWGPNVVAVAYNKENGPAEVSLVTCQ